MVQPKNNGLENLRFLWNDYVIVCYTYFIFEWMCNTAREIEAATQPLCQSGCRSRSATLAEWLTQPLGWVAGPATLAERLSGWVAAAGWLEQPPLSHSEWLSDSHQSGWVAEWLSGSVSHSGRVAEWLGWKFPPLRAQSNIFAYWWLTGIM